MNQFETVEEAVKTLKLDRRHKWYEWNGELIRTQWATVPCSGCSCECSEWYGCNHKNSGCSECGYTGKSKIPVPIPAFMPDGSIVEIKPK